jgi:hypothetical protein
MTARSESPLPLPEASRAPPPPPDVDDLIMEAQGKGRSGGLLLCRAFPPVCHEHILSRLRYSIAASEAMTLTLPRLTIFVGLALALAFGARRQLRARWLRAATGLEYSPSELEEPASPHEDCRPAPKVAAPRIADWWCSQIRLTSPALTLKCFVLALVGLELAVLMAPEEDMLATPELISLKRKKPDKVGWVPSLVPVLLPTLDETTAELWASRLRMVRALGLAAWAAYLALPPATRAAAITYAIGAAVYFALGSIGLMYNLAHSTQGPMLFVVLAAFAVPHLTDEDCRAGRWLRQTLWTCVLVPVYLFSGLSKLRYHGVYGNLTGAWLMATHSFDNDIARQVMPQADSLVFGSPLLVAFFSWGNLLIEIILPIASLLYTRGTRAAYLRMAFLVVAALFHASIFLLIGPNFSRMLLLLLFAADPLSWVARDDTTSRGPLALLHAAARSQGVVPSALPCDLTAADSFRSAVSVFVLLVWFWVAGLWSDVDHLRGATKVTSKHNLYWPIPELSMFTNPAPRTLGGPNFILSAALTATLLWMFLAKMRRWQAGARSRDSAESCSWKS